MFKSKGGETLEWSLLKHNSRRSLSVSGGMQYRGGLVMRLYLHFAFKEETDFSMHLICSYTQKLRGCIFGFSASMLLSDSL